MKSDDWIHNAVKFKLFKLGILKPGFTRYSLSFMLSNFSVKMEVMYVTTYMCYSFLLNDYIITCENHSLASFTSRTIYYKLLPICLTVTTGLTSSLWTPGSSWFHEVGPSSATDRLWSCYRWLERKERMEGRREISKGGTEGWVRRKERWGDRGLRR